MAASTSRPSVSTRSPKTTRAPSRASAFACAAPSPRAAPVTIATLPFNLRIFDLLLRLEAPALEARSPARAQTIEHRREEDHGTGDHGICIRICIDHHQAILHRDDENGAD